MAVKRKTGIAYGGEGRTQEMILCRQKQWTSGFCKEKYCQECPYKKECFELFGK